MIDLRPHQQTIIDTLLENRKGQIIVPTGGGKTMCMIKDAQKRFNDCNWDLVNKDCDRKTVVVVAPRILLAQQLCEDFVKYLARNPFLRHHILHIHSGDTHHESTTDSDETVELTVKIDTTNAIEEPTSLPSSLTTDLEALSYVASHA